MEGNEANLVMQIAAFLQAGGVFMYIIIIVWGLGIAIALERFKKLSKGF